MKTAVVYFSLDGNCAFVAQRIGEQLNADIVRLELQDEKKRSGFAKFFWAVRMAMSKKKPALKPRSFDTAAYDLLILGSPVWAGSLAPPIKTFLSETKITGKKLALFTCHARDKEAPEKFRDLLPDNTIVSETGFTSPLRQNPDELKSRIEEWVKTLAG
jgi:flavodoxin